MAEISRNWFIDRILPSNISEWDYLMQSNYSLSDFHKRYFSYKIRKTLRGVNVNFDYSGAFTDGDKSLPIHLEKVLGIEGDSPEMIFVYQMNNQSLVNYSFTFAIEFFVYFPGIANGMVKLHTRNNTYEKIGLQFLRLPSITEWNIEDEAAGIKLQFHTQKEVALWCLSSSQNSQFLDGLRVIMTFPVKIEPSSHYKIAGKIHLSSNRKVKTERGNKDAL
ncbi:MAG: DUF1926 domain-containing protein [Chitinispirillaceae bacterium]|nr:DUF1926 domain-containing protein [Chitinispirillaceae bacterium]